MLKEMLFITVVGIILNSCCCQEQGVPPLRDLPDCPEQALPVRIPITPGK